MSNKVSEPRRWWIVYAKLSPRISVFDAKPNSMESIEVIESRAYDVMKADRDRLRAVLEKMAKERKHFGALPCMAKKALEQSKGG